MVSKMTPTTLPMIFKTIPHDASKMPNCCLGAKTKNKKISVISKVLNFLCKMCSTDQTMAQRHNLEFSKNTIKLRLIILVLRLRVLINWESLSWFKISCNCFKIYPNEPSSPPPMLLSVFK